MVCRVLVPVVIVVLLGTSQSLWGQFGQPAPRRPSPDRPYYPTRPRPQPQDEIGPAILDGVIKGIQEIERAERRRQQLERYDDDYYDRPQRRPYTPPRPAYNPPQPTYNPPPAPPKAVVKSNAPPKKQEKLIKPAKNLAPSFGGGLQLTSAEHDLLTQVAKDKTIAELDKLEKLLGPAAMDPKVQDELKKLQEKADKGEEINTADINNLAMVATGAGLPPGFDALEANKQAAQLKKWSQIAADLKAEGSGGALTIPVGKITVITVPSLPQDDMALLPNGTLLVGTGGQGLVSIAQLNASDVLGVSIGVGKPVPDVETDVTKRVKEGTLLLNPAENGGTVEYVIANTNYSLQPTYTHTLPSGKSWVIRFDRGAGHGEATYTLADGTYVFGSSDKGWELYPQKFSVTIDNRGNDAAFNYNVDNQQFEVAAGASKTHDSIYPIFVCFDRGNGQEAIKKVHDAKLTLQVAVDPSDNLWQLYSGAKSAVAQSSSDSTSEERSSKTRAARLRALLMQTSGAE